jgi:phosphatidate phosphatase APP1
MAVVWQISVVPFKDYTLINGVILHNACPVNKNNSHLWSIFLSTMKTYFRQPLSEQEILIKIAENTVNTQTNKAGEFWIETELPVNNDVDVYLVGQDTPLEFCQSYPVYQQQSILDLAAISDIDDTILVSYTSSLLKRIGALLFIAPHKRQPISFTRSLLTVITKSRGRIFYVSKSESNLFRVLTAVIQYHEIPAGHLFLTPYLKFRQLLNSKKGKDYKNLRIKKVIDHASEKKFILLGDDTQHDIRIYTEIALAYPEKILKIYIRRTHKSLSHTKQQQMNKLKQLPVPTVYFSDLDDVSEELSIIEQYLNKQIK